MPIDLNTKDGRGKFLKENLSNLLDSLNLLGIVKNVSKIVFR